MDDDDAEGSKGTRLRGSITFFFFFFFPQSFESPDCINTKRSGKLSLLNLVTGSPLEANLEAKAALVAVRIINKQAQNLRAQGIPAFHSSCDSYKES